MTVDPDRARPARRKGLYARISGELRRRRHQRAQSALATLTGAPFATAATDPVGQYWNAAITVDFERESGRYVVRDGSEHRLTDPKRLKYYVRGLPYRAQQVFEEYLLDHISFEDGDSIVESGAYDGDFVLALELARKTMRLTSFEPSPENARTAAINQSMRPFLLAAEVRPRALWHTSGEQMSFHLKVASADSSLLPIDGATGTVSVETARLDDALPRRRHKLLKLEAEGAEPEVIEGAEGMLPHFEYISADLGFERGVRQESTLPQVVNYLLPRGFEVVAVGRRRLMVLFRNRRGQEAETR